MNPTCDLLLDKISELNLIANYVEILNLRLQVLKVAPEHIDNKIELVRILSLTDLNGAIAILDDALAKQSIDNDPTTHLRLLFLHAEVLQSNGQYQNALNILNGAKKLHPHNFWPLIYLSNLESSQSNYKKALSLIDDAAAVFGNEQTSLIFFKEYAKVLEKINDVEYAGVTSSAEGEPIHNVLLAYLIKDEADIISQNLCHHYIIGFRNFVITDNNSSDDTANLISIFKERYPDANVIYIKDTIIGYNQSVKTNAMSRYAISMLMLLDINVDWVLPVDADEFFIPGQQIDMKALFDKADKAGMNTISFSWNNAATSDIESPILSNEDIFKRFNLRLKKPTDYVFKVAARVIEGNEFVQGNHATTLAYKFLPLTMPASNYECFILHLHMRNFTHMKKKVINGGIAALNANVPIASHWKSQYAQFLNKGDFAIRNTLDSYRLIFKNHGYDIKNLK